MKLSPEQKELIFGAIGEASMCWAPRPSKQVFDSTRAKQIGEELILELEKSFECPTCKAIGNKDW